MELLPRAIVTGVYAAVAPAAGGAPAVTEEKINRIWAEVSPRSEYRQLQIAEDGSAAQLVGKSGDNGASIQLPLIQVRSSIDLSHDDAADLVQANLRSIANHLGLTQFFNLAIKHIYHAPVTNRDARDFVLRNVLRRDEASFERLQRGDDFWTGLKMGLKSPDSTFYMLTIEPRLSDNEALFIDLDAQFPGVATLDTVRERAREAHEFARSAVKDFLDEAETTV
jgi:hypothetical protein